MPPTQRVAFLLDGIRAQRETLESGSFRVSGRVLSGSNHEQGGIQGQLRIFCAFDFPSGKLRFDREEPKDYPVVGTETEEALIQGGQWVRTRDHVISLMRGRDVVHVLPVHNTNASLWAKPFDVRALGMSFRYELDRGTQFEEVWENYKSLPVTDVEEQVDGMWKIAWIGGDEIKTKVEMTLDTQHGYWPLELSVQSSVPASEGPRWMPANFTSELSIREVSGCWVPSVYSWRTPEYSQNLDFEWESLNRPLEEELFTADGFELSSANRIVDKTLGAPIVVRNLAAEKRTKEFESEHPPGMRSRLWLVTLSLLLLLLVIAAVSYKRRIDRLRSAEGGATPPVEPGKK